MFIKALCNLFIPGYDRPDDLRARAAIGIFSGYVGVTVNLLLFALKITVGIISGSVAIAADAINNLSDSGSGIITILGFKLSAKPADREHPFGHGRIELCCGVVVAVIIMMMGFDFMKEAIGKIISPEKVNINPLLTGLVAGSMLFKLWLFFFYRHIGRTINSTTIMASAFDSLSDLISTSVVLAAVIVSRYTAFPLDGCAGAVVALLVLIGGGKILRDTINPLLGEPPGEEFVKELESRLLQCEGIHGIHDIIIHNYGPNQYFATAHAEVDLNGDLLAVHDMLECAEVEIGKHMPIHLLLHCDPYNSVDPEGKIWRVRLENITAGIDPIFKVYDFRMKKDEARVILTSHILIPRNYALSEADILKKLNSGMQKHTPAPELQIDFMYPYV